MRAALWIAVILPCAACAGSRPPPAPPASVVEPAVAATRVHEPPPMRLAGSRHEFRYCVVRRGELEVVPLEYNTRTGDSTYQGVPIARAFPLDSAYAEGAEWFVNQEPIRYGRPRWYVRYGVPRLLGVFELTRVGEFRGVGVYAEAGRPESDPEVIYLPVRPGCIFQPYNASGAK